MVGKVHFIAFSPCGGTEKILDAVGRDIMLPRQMHNITLGKDRKDHRIFDKDELVFLGFPVYGGRMPRHFSSLIASLRGNGTPAVMVAVYGNRAFEGAFLDMHDAIGEIGFIPVAAVAAIAQHSSAPHIATGRPDDADKDTLAKFGLAAVEKAQNTPDEIAAPGAYPTWKLPAGATYFPRVDAAVCNACGRCALVCPTGSISDAAPQTTVTDTCIICAACVKYCPQKARVLGDPATRKALSSHLDQAVTRKESELFI